jgi:small subunit ribosomal protein S16
MAVRIRLRRVGRKKQPSYRIVVTESENPRGGAYMDTLGYYNPRGNPAELRIDLNKVDEWVGRGATMSETTENLVRKARRGGTDQLKVSSTTPADATPASE